MPKNNVNKSYLRLHLIVFIWGFTAVIGALITKDALPLVWYRMVFAGVFIALYVYFKKFPLQFPLKTLFIFMIGGLIIAVHWLTFFKAIKESNVSVTLACMATGAFFTSLLEPIFYKRKVVFYEVLFGCIVFLGLYIIFNIEMKYTYGILLALSSAFLSALFSVVNGSLAKKYNPAVISFYEILGGVGFLSLYLLFSGGFTADFFNLSIKDLFWLLILSSICTAYAFLASVAVMKYLSPYTVMLTINLEPIYGIVLALLVFNDKEKMNPMFYLGAFVILVTVILNGIIKNKKSVNTD